MASRLLLGSVIFLLAGQASAQAPEPVFISQSPDWTASARADFYTRDQGSKVIPLAWMQALRQPDGQPFLADSLARYGYLPNPGEPGPPAGRLHGLRAARSADARDELRGLPHPADHGRGAAIPDRRRPRLRRFPELPRPTSTRRSAKVAERRRDVRRLRQGGPALLDARCRRRRRPQAGGQGLVRALPHPDEPRPAEAAGAALGPGPARRRRHDLQPPHRPRSRAAAEPADPGEHQGRRRAGALPVPVERGDPGHDAMAGLRRRTATMSSRSPATSGRCSACSASSSRSATASCSTSSTTTRRIGTASTSSRISSSASRRRNGHGRWT